MNTRQNFLLIIFHILLIYSTSYSQNAELADNYSHQAYSLYQQGRYFEAAQMYERSAEAEKSSQQPRLDKLAVQLGYAGYLYSKISQYDKAIEYNEEALEIFRKLGHEINTANLLNNIGRIYDDWGQYDRAIEYYEKALAIFYKQGREDMIAMSLNNIGMVYLSWRQYDRAIKNFTEALTTFRKHGQEGLVAIALNSIGLVYLEWGQYDRAVKNFTAALTIFRKHGQEDKVAMSHNNIGGVYENWGQYDRAIEYYEEALAIIQKLGYEDKIAISYNNIGSVYFTSNMYTEAIKNFVKSVEISEKLRKTAKGEVRRDYIASQVHTYQFLTSAHLRNGDLQAAFHTIELSRAKLLAEQLASTESEVSVASVKQIQMGMPSDAVILAYANVSWKEKIIIAITEDMIYGLEISDDDFITSAMGMYENSIQTMFRNQRGIQKVKKDKNEVSVDSVNERDEFEDVINYYRSLLTNPSRTNNERARDLGGMLYNFLIKPVAESIGEKTEIIIIPDGVLGFIPFETLIDEKGRYLVETHEIKYIQSMGILNRLKNRNYEMKQKPMLAFGGAVYDEVNYEVDMVENENQLVYLEKEVYSAFNDRRSTRNAYASLGVADWSNLPGTLKEVREIKRTVDGAEILTGDEATENRVKALSISGELSKYKVLHFATHGLVVPALPELSALVLSQFAVERGGEDGYLRMGEIADLNIRADFVNLSACETGLGKIYGGEGIVGLTQSFLIAGANGLSVSLWQVADVSTSKFMIAMYELEQTNETDYAHAITEIKRQFIKGEFGEEYKEPYYWAPFVYYGK